MIEGQASRTKTPKLRYGMVGGGQGVFIGEVRFVNGEYPQEWLAAKLEDTGQKQAAWRTDPALAGISNCVGDIGSHVEFMAGHMTCLRIESLCARLDRPTGIISRGRDPMSPRAQSPSRIPSGHPEGYFEGFANVYSTFITALAKKLQGELLADDDLDFPSVDEGLQGVRYIEKCVESSAKGSVWVDMGTDTRT